MSVREQTASTVSPTGPAGDAPVGTLHALAWGWWALCGVAALQLAPSPSAAIVVVAVAALVATTAPRRGTVAAVVPLVLGLTTVFVGLRVLLTVATTHPGGPALLVLPTVTLPTLLGGFDVGGSIETAVLLRALAEGAVVLAVIAVFLAFNLVISHAELLRALPRALHEVGLVVSIAVAFLPSLAGSITAVREADRARTGGRVVRRGRAVRTLVPVLEGALERALLLAESMDARGYARRTATTRTPARWVGPLGLALLVVAFGLVVGRLVAVAAATGLLGIALVVGATVATGRGLPERYRPRRLARVDVVAMAAASLAPLGVVAAGVVGAAVPWDPATSAVPPFDPVTAGALVALAVPPLLRPAPPTAGA